MILCNRAFAHIKLEEYGSAVEDAGTAIELDPAYVKGYYRRGDSYLALGKFKLALKDLRTVRRHCWVCRCSRRPCLWLPGSCGWRW
jgi:serine/threonine-protein phosphatase 5